MRCFEIDLNHILKISMLNKQEYFAEYKHMSRRTKEYIMYFVADGSLELLVDNEPVTLYPGDVYLFPKGCYQKPAKQTPCEFYFIHFDAESVREAELSDAEYAESVHKRHTSFLKTNIYDTECYSYEKVILKQHMRVDRGFLDYIIKTLESNYISYEKNSPALRLNISYAVAGMFLKLEQFASEPRLKSQKQKQSSVYHTVSRIRDYIEANHLKPIDSNDIERELLINFDYANRIFKEHFGCSIIRYRNILRINTAKTRMLLSEKPLGEIAEETGFKDVYYFSRYFKSVEGVSPSQYRKSVMKY